MKRTLFLGLLFVLSISFVGCVSDPSPLKSQLEVSLNKTFNMEFDYLDQIEIYHWNSKERKYELFQTLNEEQVNELGNEMAKAKEIEGIKVSDFTYKVVLSTSNAKVEYNRKQTKAEMFLFMRDQEIFIFYNNNLYKAPNHLKDLLERYGVKFSHEMPKNRFRASKHKGLSSLKQANCLRQQPRLILN